MVSKYVALTNAVGERWRINDACIAMYGPNTSGNPQLKSDVYVQGLTQPIPVKESPEQIDRLLFPGETPWQ
jgi:hypothetical protein